jgi:hypothetical protein
MCMKSKVFQKQLVILRSTVFKPHAILDPYVRVPKSSVSDPESGSDPEQDFFIFIKKIKF